MKQARKLNRRSFLVRVAGGLAVAGGAMTALSPARAQVTDADSGPNADAPGRGRGSRGIRGCTDSDRGASADPANFGRGNRRSDSDSGPNGDPPGCARPR